MKVVRPIMDEERKVLGREFVFKRFAKPHGYAVVESEFEVYFLHPESLERVWAEGWPEDPGDVDSNDPMLYEGSDYGTGNE